MKKILFLLIISSLCLPVFSQKLSVNKIENGVHVVQSYWQNIYSTSSGKAASISIMALKSDNSNSVDYQLCFCFNEDIFTFQPGRRLLLKLANDSIITLKNSENIGPGDYTFKVNDFGRTLYFTYPKYNITKGQIEDIINYNVIKIRVETDNNEFDRDIKKKAMSKAVEKFYNEVEIGVATKNSIYDNF